MSGPAHTDDDCPHVAETGSHHFPRVKDSFDHAFGTERWEGWGRCECGADPNDHDIAAPTEDYDDDPFDAGDPEITYEDYMLERAR